MFQTGAPQSANTVLSAALSQSESNVGDQLRKLAAAREALGVVAAADECLLHEHARHAAAAGQLSQRVLDVAAVIPLIQLRTARSISRQGINVGTYTVRSPRGTSRLEQQQLGMTAQGPHIMLVRVPLVPFTVQNHHQARTKQNVTRGAEAAQHKVSDGLCTAWRAHLDDRDLGCWEHRAQCSFRLRVPLAGVNRSQIHIAAGQTRCEVDLGHRKGERGRGEGLVGGTACSGAGCDWGRIREETANLRAVRTV